MCHNDFKSDNVAYIHTQHKWQYVAIKPDFDTPAVAYLRIPTYGREFVLIDFGFTYLQCRDENYCSISPVESITTGMIYNNLYTDSAQLAYSILREFLIAWPDAFWHSISRQDPNVAPPVEVPWMYLIDFIRDIATTDSGELIAIDTSRWAEPMYADVSAHCTDRKWNIVMPHILQRYSVVPEQDDVVARHVQRERAQHDGHAHANTGAANMEHAHIYPDYHDGVDNDYTVGYDEDDDSVHVIEYIWPGIVAYQQRGRSAPSPTTTINNMSASSALSSNITTASTNTTDASTYMDGGMRHEHDYPTRRVVDQLSTDTTARAPLHHDHRQSQDEKTAYDLRQTHAPSQGGSLSQIPTGYSATSQPSFSTGVASSSPYHPSQNYHGDYRVTLSNAPSIMPGKYYPPTGSIVVSHTAYPSQMPSMSSHMTGFGMQ